MPQFTHCQQQQINISPNQLAELFWSMDSGEQVQFFDHIGRICSDSYKRQLQWLNIMERSTTEAREVMRDLGWAANEIYFEA